MGRSKEESQAEQEVSSQEGDVVELRGMSQDCGGEQERPNLSETSVRNDNGELMHNHCRRLVCAHMQSDAVEASTPQLDTAFAAPPPMPSPL